MNSQQRELFTNDGPTDRLMTSLQSIKTSLSGNISGDAASNAAYADMTNVITVNTELYLSVRDNFVNSNVLQVNPGEIEALRSEFELQARDPEEDGFVNQAKQIIDPFDSFIFFTEGNVALSNMVNAVNMNTLLVKYNRARNILYDMEKRDARNYGRLKDQLKIDDFSGYYNNVGMAYFNELYDSNNQLDRTWNEMDYLVNQDLTPALPPQGNIAPAPVAVPPPSSNAPSPSGVAIVTPTPDPNVTVGVRR
jgi:hypothetical protein